MAREREAGTADQECADRQLLGSFLTGAFLFALAPCVPPPPSVPPSRPRCLPFSRRDSGVISYHSLSYSVAIPGVPAFPASPLHPQPPGSQYFCSQKCLGVGKTGRELMCCSGMPALRTRRRLSRRAGHGALTYPAFPRPFASPPCA